MTKHIPEKDLPDLPSLEHGVYRHYKGGLYEVLGVAMHSETLEPLVVYKPLYETSVKFWARPYSIFLGSVAIHGKTVARFEKVSDA